MNRTHSALAQLCFSLANRLLHYLGALNPPFRRPAMAAGMIGVTIAKWIGAGKLVKAHLYGHDLIMPIEHPLVPIQELFPCYNRPLAHSAQALAERNRSQPRLVVVDVGANIGETVAIIAEQCGDIGQYLCIEADQELAELCEANLHDNRRVTVERCLIGEDEGSTAWLEDSHRSNPSTRLAAPPSAASSAAHVVRLDTVVAPYAELHGGLDMIKVDTEGYDFAVLRSGTAMLEKYHPALYFEWFPKLLAGFGENSAAAFERLVQLGYRHYVFFTNHGEIFRSTDALETPLLRDLEAITLSGGPIKYFDVFATTDGQTSDRLVALSAPTRK